MQNHGKDTLVQNAHNPRNTNSQECQTLLILLHTSNVHLVVGAPQKPLAFPRIPWKSQLGTFLHPTLPAIKRYQTVEVGHQELFLQEHGFFKGSCFTADIGFSTPQQTSSNGFHKIFAYSNPSSAIQCHCPSRLFSANARCGPDMDPCFHRNIPVPAFGRTADHFPAFHGMDKKSTVPFTLLGVNQKGSPDWENLAKNELM